jgi:uncharacterized protein YbaR (Trm112 family)
MHLSLSDLLTCPRCGPAHGLILLPGERRGRRLATGALGCPNCRERFAIDDGVADLRVPGTQPANPPAGGGGGGGEADRAMRGSGGPGEDDPAIRLAALLDLASATGVVVLAGPAAAHAADLARLMEPVEVVALGGFGEPAHLPPGQVSRILVTGRLPFRDGALAGIALTGPATALLEDGARAVRPAARMLLAPADARLRARAEDAGMIVALHAGEILVVTRRP